ncbi:hypothetical protein HD554DRAFT_2038758 [Boletus coccyginus]|nr:hypothetical protein HD554DRAFT_2038758 [Boletus coccyginus]
MQTIISIPVNEACCSGTDSCKCESKFTYLGAHYRRLYVAYRILHGWRRAIPQWNVPLWGPHGSEKVRWGSPKGASAPERPASPSRKPPHSFYPHRNQSIRGRAPAVAGHFVVWPTPSIGLKIGSWYPKRSRKDSGRGSGSPLTRAFAGSKPHARTRPLLIHLRLYRTWFSMVRL